MGGRVSRTAEKASSRLRSVKAQTAAAFGGDGAAGVPGGGGLGKLRAEGRLGGVQRGPGRPDPTRGAARAPSLLGSVDHGACHGAAGWA